MEIEEYPHSHLVGFKHSRLVLCITQKSYTVHILFEKECSANNVQNSLEGREAEMDGSRRGLVIAVIQRELMR